MDKDLSGKLAAAKSLAITSLALLAIAIIVVIVTDAVILGGNIFVFAGAAISSVGTFLGLCILWALGWFVLIIVGQSTGNYTLLPHNLATDVFNGIMGDALPVQEKLIRLSSIRIVLIVIFLVAVVLAALSILINSFIEKEDPEQKSKFVSRFGGISFLASIAGIIIGFVILLMLSVF